MGPDGSTLQNRVRPQARSQKSGNEFGFDRKLEMEKEMGMAVQNIAEMQNCEKCLLVTCLPHLTSYACLIVVYTEFYKITVKNHTIKPGILPTQEC